MNALPTPALLLVAVLLAVAGNYASTAWATGARAGPWLWITLALSPLVFLSFGLVARALGLARGAVAVDASMTLLTVAVGLVALGEWRELTRAQVIGTVLAVAGVLLITRAPAR